MTHSKTELILHGYPETGLTFERSQYEEGQCSLVTGCSIELAPARGSLGDESNLRPEWLRGQQLPLQPGECHDHIQIMDPSGWEEDR